MQSGAAAPESIFRFFRSPYINIIAKRGRNLKTSPECIISHTGSTWTCSGRPEKIQIRPENRLPGRFIHWFFTMKARSGRPENFQIQMMCSSDTATRLCKFIQRGAPRHFQLDLKIDRYEVQITIRRASPTRICMRKARSARVRRAAKVVQRTRKWANCVELLSSKALESFPTDSKVARCVRRPPIGQPRG